MTDLIVLGFPNRATAEEARRRSVELVEHGALNLNGAALAYRHEDGRLELVQPLHLAVAGAATGGITGGLIGMVLLIPLLTAAVGAAAGAVSAEVSARILNVMFLRSLKETLAPGRAALFLVIRTAIDSDSVVDALRPLAPTVLRTNWDREQERRLIEALTQDM